MNKGIKIEHDSNEQIAVVFDKTCPACRLYCEQTARVEPELYLVDAREPSALRDEITAKGWDIDEGMVVKRNGTLYYGADAISELARASQHQSWWNKLTQALFADRRRAQLLYPLLAAMRALLLKLLRKTKINNLGHSNNERF